MCVSAVSAATLTVCMKTKPRTARGVRNNVKQTCQTGVYPISGIPTLSKPNCKLLVHAAGSALPLIRGLKLNAEKCISRAENEKYSHCTIVVLP